MAIARVLRWLVLAALLLFLVSCGVPSGSIGAILGKHNETGRVTIREAPRGMGASDAGLLAGDQIVLIDGRDARKMTAEQVHEALSGPIGTTVALTVERDGQILRVSIKRGPLRRAPGQS